jgi:hypothetical protein
VGSDKGKGDRDCGLGYFSYLKLRARCESKECAGIFSDNFFWVKRVYDEKGQPMSPPSLFTEV